MPIDGTLFRASIIGNCHGSGIIQTFHFLAKHANATALLLATKVRDRMTGGVISMKATSNECRFNTVFVQNITQPTETGAQLSIDAVGNAFGPAHHNSLAILLNLYTGLQNRSGRGRIYLPVPIGSFLNQGGMLNATGIAVGNEVGNYLIQQWNAPDNNDPDFSWVVYSRKLQQVNEVKSFTVSARFAVLHSRKPFVGF